MFIVQLIVIQTIIFGIVIFMLKKMLYGDTETAVSRLDNSYKESTQKKEELAKMINDMEKEYQKKKAEAETIAAEVKEQKEKEALERKEEIFKKAKAEAERIVVDAQMMRDKIREDIVKEESDRMYMKCAELLKETFSGVIRGKFNDIFIEDFLDQFEEVDISKISPDLKEIELVASCEISEEIRNKIRTKVNEKLGRSFDIKEIVDENILAGVIVKFGSLVLDGSLAARINDKLEEKVV